jgi:alcohol dehydrogenase
MYPAASAEWRYHNPTHIIFGEGKRAELGAIACDQKMLIVSSKRGQKAALDDPLMASNLARAAFWLNDIMPNPDVSYFEDIMSRVQDVNLIVAIGGGSAIDAAKVLSALLSCTTGGQTVADVIASPNQYFGDTVIPVVAIPTTAGTGSEVTPFATVWDHARRKKLSLTHPLLFPRYAIVDPELSYHAPRDLTIATGLDALNQAFESAWNKNCSPYSLQLAARSAGIAMSALAALASDLDSKLARRDMAEASLLAGLAISQTRTALCHSISYPLTAHFGVAHGLACAFTMRDVARELIGAMPNSLDSFAHAAGYGSGAALIEQLDWLFETIGFDDCARKIFPTMETVTALHGAQRELLACAELRFARPNSKGKQSADFTMNLELSSREYVWKQAIDEVVKLITLHKIQYFLDTGTLLGAVREGAFISWDNDIDIGVAGDNFRSYRTQAFAKDCARRGFLVNMSTTGIGLFSAHGVEINIKYYEQQNDNFIADFSYYHHPWAIIRYLFNIAARLQLQSYGNSGKQRLKMILAGCIRPFAEPLARILRPLMSYKELKSVVEANKILPVSKVQMYDTLYNAPGMVSEYLEARYGLDWRTPKQEYNYMTDDQSFGTRAD